MENKDWLDIGYISLIYHLKYNTLIEHPVRLTFWLHISDNYKQRLRLLKTGAEHELIQATCIFKKSFFGFFLKLIYGAITIFEIHDRITTKFMLWLASAKHHPKK